MNNNVQKRKCNYCKQDFYINKENINEVIYYGKTYYHSKCFVDLCQKRTNSTRENTRKKWNEILQNIKIIQNESCKHFNNVLVKDEIFQFVKQHYGVVIIPSFIWQKISNIYNGSYKGMSVGIPPEHLLDMWKRKIQKLDKLAMKNKSIGKNMTPEQRINYDLSVLVNKYNSYLQWLEKQKIIEAETTQSTLNNIITTDFIANSQTYNTYEEDSNDMVDLVDDIFGDN